MRKNSNKFKYKRIDSEIKKELQVILLNDVSDPMISGFVNIIDVDVNKDLSFCKVYVSIQDNNKNEIMKGLDRARGFIRHELAVRINLRKTPEIKFYLDNTLENMNRIEEMINKIKKS